MTNISYLSRNGGKKENDDFVLFEKGKDGFFALVADGLGAYGGGAIAARTAAETVARKYQKGKLSSKEEIKDAIKEANQKILEKQTFDCKMKSTIALLVRENDSFSVTHVGDSRIYYFKDGKYVRRTLDHSVSQMAVFLGEITEEEIRFHEDRSKILRALGSDSCEPEIRMDQNVGKGFHAFLLCTDGFWEYVYEEEMESLLKSAGNPDIWLREMENLLLERTDPDHDNYSAIAVFCRE